MLADKNRHTKQIRKQASPALLSGLLFDGNSQPLICHHANKQRKRYYYYVSRTDDNDPNDQIKLRLPIQMIEQLVINVLRNAFDDETALLKQIEMHNFTVEQIVQIKVQCHQLALQLMSAKPNQFKSLLQNLIQQIKIGDEQIVITLCNHFLLRN